MEAIEAKQILKDLAPYVKPVRQVYKCETCDKTWMKWFFVTKFFRGFPRVRFCGKECKTQRHVSKKNLATT